MRRKAVHNLDDKGTTSPWKSFLSFSSNAMTTKLNNIGVSLGSNEKDICVSIDALR